MAKQQQMRIPALTDDGGRAEVVIQKPSFWKRAKGLFRMDQNLWAEQIMIFNGMSYPLGGYGAGVSDDHEAVPNDFESYVADAYKGSGAVFAGMEAWRLAFCEIRFQYQRLNKGRPGNLFGMPALSILEEPWENAFTADLLARAINHYHLAGNHYVVTEGVGANQRLRVLRPDWVQIILTSPPDKAVKSDIAGYLYKPGGTEDKKLWKVYPIDGSQGTVAHWAPTPDPDAQYRGMSPLTPIMTEIMSDKAITKHKYKWFHNGASPSIAVSFKDVVTDEQFKKMMQAVNREHRGVDNAYKPMYLGGGADVKVLNAEPIDFLNIGGHTEPLALDTKVPTPTGWTTMGDISVGDMVFGRDGSVANVLGVHDVHVGRKCYEVEFNDGTKVTCDASHLWTVYDRRKFGTPEVTITAQEMFDQFDVKRAQERRFAIDMNPVLDCPEADLPIEPYALGAWLGDGFSAGAAVCGAADDLKHIEAVFNERGHKTRRRNTAVNKVPIFGVLDGFLAQLRDQGLINNKHIPAAYLRASRDQRLELLRGLMDTDGCISKSGQCSFGSKWIHLTEQVAELVRSLGIRVHVTRTPDARSRTGETCLITFRTDIVPFRLPRKVDRCSTQPDMHVMRRSVVSVRECESVPVRCITVDTEDHLFLVGDGMIPTHNTRILAALNIHPTLVGLAENLHGSTLNQGNYGASKDRFIDMGLRPQWRSLSQAYSVLVPKLNNARLWFDTRDIAFLRSDRQAEAAYLQSRASTISSYITAGFTPDSAVQAVVERDESLLRHTGLFSVQLQEPGAVMPATPGTPDANQPGAPNQGANEPDKADGGNASSGTDQSGGTSGSSGSSGSSGTSGSGGN